MKSFRLWALLTTLGTVLLALAIILVMIHMCSNKSHEKALNADPVYNGLLGVYIIAIMVQAGIMCVGFLGFYVAFSNWRNNYQMDHSIRTKFISFVALWCMFGLLNLGLAISFLIRFKEPQEEISALYQTFVKYNQDVKFVAQFERYQRESGCCGIFGPDDWTLVQIQQGAGGMAGPPGGGSSGGFQSLDYGFRQNPSTGQCHMTPPTIPSGCGRKMLDEIHIGLNMFGGVMIFESIVALFACIFAGYSFFYWLEKEVIVIPEDEVSNLIILEPESSTATEVTERPSKGGYILDDPYMYGLPYDSDPYLDSSLDPSQSSYGGGGNSYRSTSSSKRSSMSYPFGSGESQSGRESLPTNGSSRSRSSRPSGSFPESSGNILGNGLSNKNVLANKTPSGSQKNPKSLGGLTKGQTGGGPEDADVIYSRQSLKGSNNGSRSRYAVPLADPTFRPELNSRYTPKLFQQSRQAIPQFYENQFPRGYPPTGGFRVPQPQQLYYSQPQPPYLNPSQAGVYMRLQQESIPDYPIELFTYPMTYSVNNNAVTQIQNEAMWCKDNVACPYQRPYQPGREYLEPFTIYRNQQQPIVNHVQVMQQPANFPGNRRQSNAMDQNRSQQQQIQSQRFYRDQSQRDGQSVVSNGGPPEENSMGSYAGPSDYDRRSVRSRGVRSKDVDSSSSGGRTRSTFNRSDYIPQDRVGSSARNSKVVQKYNSSMRKGPSEPEVIPEEKPLSKRKNRLKKQEAALGGRVLGEMRLDHRKDGDDEMDDGLSRHATVAIVRNKNAPKAKKLFADNKECGGE